MLDFGRTKTYINLNVFASRCWNQSFGTHRNGHSHSGYDGDDGDDGGDDDDNDDVITFGRNSGPILVKSSVQKLVSTIN